MSKYNPKFSFIAPDDRSVFITRTAIAVILICGIFAVVYYYGPRIIASWNELKYEQAAAMIKNKEIKEVIAHGDLLLLTDKNGKEHIARYEPSQTAEEMIRITTETGTGYRGKEDLNTGGWLYAIGNFPRTTFIFFAVAAAALLGVVYRGFFFKV